MTRHEKACEPKYQNHGNCINVISRKLHLELLNEQRYEQRDRDREREREREMLQRVNQQHDIYVYVVQSRLRMSINWYEIADQIPRFATNLVVSNKVLQF